MQRYNHRIPRSTKFRTLVHQIKLHGTNTINLLPCLFVSLIMRVYVSSVNITSRFCYVVRGLLRVCCDYSFLFHFSFELLFVATMHHRRSCKDFFYVNFFCFPPKKVTQLSVSVKNTLRTTNGAE